MELRPLIRRKKLDRGEHLRPFIGPSCSFTGASDLGLPVTLPLSSLISVAPADPSNVAPLLRIFDDPYNVSSATYLAQPSLHRPSSKRHRELRPRRVSRAGRLVTKGGLVAPARCELLSVPIAVALHRSSVAGEAMPAAGPRRPAAGHRAADPAQRKKPGKPDFLEVVEFIEGPERHASCVPGASATVLSHTLTSIACLRRTPSQAREPRRFPTEEVGVETAIDGSQVSPIAGNGAGGHALAEIEPLEGGGAVLAELARAVEHDLATPDHAPATERAYAHDWADFAAFCGRHGLPPLPAAPQTLALYLKALETQRSRSPAGLAAGTVGLSLPMLRRRLAAIASRHATAGFETPTEHSLVRRLLRRYSRARGTAVRKKEPLLIEQLPAILAAMPDDQLAARDRTLLLLGYAGAFRRSELVALDVEQLRFSKAGCYVWIASAKNDPRKKGRELFVPRLPATSTKSTLCAVAALERWLVIVGPAGPVFRTFDLRKHLTTTRLDSGDVPRILRRRAAAAGLSGDFAGHSLRRGFITNAAKKKVSIENIKRVTGQRSSGIMLNYIAAATIDDEPPLLDIIDL